MQLSDPRLVLYWRGEKNPAIKNTIGPTDKNQKMVD